MWRTYLSVAASARLFQDLTLGFRSGAGVRPERECQGLLHVVYHPRWPENEEEQRLRRPLPMYLNLCCPYLAQLSQLRTLFGFFTFIFIVKRCVFMVAL
jgi:hypothetical protein